MTTSNFPKDVTNLFSSPSRILIAGYSNSGKTHYNDSPHRGLGANQTPNQIHVLTTREDVERQFAWMYIKKYETKKTFSFTLSVGRTLRIADEKRNAPFRSGFTMQNTYEIFRIRRIDKSQQPTVYYLDDSSGEKIQGMIYREELIPTTLPELYDIIVLRRKTVGGKRKYLVKWSGYPDHFNSWLDESHIIQV
ncbi:uncharacterized protein [Palaemon carinicauda]|uniref:uncharacterized protein n=1 Tax=Palaemon carinicauda TaxID=392227 RepID=UPI0035B622E4